MTVAHAAPAGEARIAHVRGDFILCAADAERIAGVGVERWFDRDYWREAGRPLGEKTGRGAVVVLDHGAEQWVLRHYKRGGLVSRFVEDHYVWTGLERTRSFREWRMLARLHALGLPVPRPIAARAARSGLLYQADIATAYLPGARPLSAILNEGAADENVWGAVGRMIRAFHDRGIDHPDLTAHNILLGPAGEVFLVDFDNARRRPPGRWCGAGLARLQRSLRKVALETGGAFDPDGWRVLERAYGFEGSSVG
ncbi:MAG TPA: 3-deoxy-D-manno-octulosonic acid kinase [Gammaproteobacteria bacterium]|nr:3-deoxy-D-manno-octulosonic acid kinase [Gammaproteobacteria bacterium]